MCLESRITALLVALCSIVMSGGAQIHGRLVTADHQLLANGALVMTPEDSDGSASSIDGNLVPDGSFVFNNVPPGTYLIRALAQIAPNAPSLFALFRVSVRDRDVDGIELVLRPGATISGQIIIEPRSGVRDPRSGDDTARSTSLMTALAGVRVRAPL